MSTQTVRLGGDGGWRRLLNPFAIVALGATLAMLALLAYPLLRVLVRVVFGEGQSSVEEALSIFAEPWLPQVFINTTIVVAVSTLLAVGVGALLAWVNERTDASLGPVGPLLSIIPLVIPHVALTIGWVFIAAPKVGFLNGLLALLPEGWRFQVDIYSWAGMILIYAMYGVPYVYLIVSAALRNVDPAIEEASRTSGAGLWRTFWRVSVPAIGPALGASTFLVAITGIGLYSVPAVIGTTARIDILTTRMVHLLGREFPPKMAEAQMLGLATLLVVALLWFLQNRASDRGGHVTVGGRASGSTRLQMGAWKWPARLGTLTFLLATSVLPLAALLIVSLQPFWTPKINPAVLDFDNYAKVLFVDRMALSSFTNSLQLSLAGASIAMAVAILLAVFAALYHSWISTFTDAAIKSSAAIPGVILALAFLITFSGPPFNLAGTATILLIAFVIMYMPAGSIAATSAVAQVGRDLREASYTSGAGELRTTLRILLPLALPGFIAGWAIVFVHMMGDLSAAALLAGRGNPVIGFAILAIWETGTFGTLAALSVMMCVVNVTIIAIVLALGRLAGRR